MHSSLNLKQFFLNHPSLALALLWTSVAFIWDTWLCRDAFRVSPNLAAIFSLSSPCIFLTMAWVKILERNTADSMSSWVTRRFSKLGSASEVMSMALATRFLDTSSLS